MQQPAQSVDTSGRSIIEDFIKFLRLKPESEKAFRAGMKMSTIDGAPPVTMVLRFGSSATATPECVIGCGRAEVKFVA